MSNELSEEQVFSNDLDPMEALAEIRREEENVANAEPQETSESSDSVEDEELSEIQDLPEDDSEETASSDDNGEDGSTDTTEEALEDSPESEEESKDPSEPSGVEDKLVFKADGKNYEFTKEEAIEQFGNVFGKAMHFTQKMQKIAPYRKMISAIEEQNITSEQLNIAIDALKGNKDAISKIADMNNIDTFELSGDDVNKDYVPENHGKSEAALNLEEVVNTINMDKEFPTTVNVLETQMDQQSREAFAENPNLIAGLHNDIKTGRYDIVAPAAMKLKVLDGNAKSDLEYYILADSQLQEQREKQTPSVNPAQGVQDAEREFDKASSEASKKRSATHTGRRADRGTVLDYMDDDDEKFDSWYNKIQQSI